MLKRIAFTFPVIFILACNYMVVPIAISHQYEGKDTGITQWLNVDGYYVGREESKGKAVRYYGLMLYRDGTVAYEPQIVYRTEADFVKDFVSNPESQKFTEDWKGWGIYHIVGDTLKVISTQRFKNSKIETEHSQFLIRSRNQLELIEGKYKDDGRKMLVYQAHRNRIDSSHWLKEQDWFAK